MDRVRIFAAYGQPDLKVLTALPGHCGLRLYSVLSPSANSHQKAPMLQLQFSKKAGILGAVSYFLNQHSPLLALIARARECLH